MPTFNGENIFGFAVRQEQFAKMRIMREELPGVQGYRLYNLSGVNPDTRCWTVRGRLLDLSATRLEQTLASGENYMDGLFYTFVTNGKRTFKNCQMIDFRQASAVRRVRVAGVLYSTCEIVASIEQASP